MTNPTPPRKSNPTLAPDRLAAGAGPLLAAPTSSATVFAALGQGLTVQSDWVPCPLALDGLDLTNTTTVTLTLLANPSEGLAQISETGALLRIADAVLLLDSEHRRFLSVPLNTIIRAEAGSTLVLPEHSLRTPLGTTPSAEIGWLGGHGAFVGATTPH